MFKFFSRLFSQTPEHGLGVVLNPADPRDVQVVSFQKENSLPEKLITDITMLPRYDQKQLGACVGHAVALALAYYEYKETGKTEALSPRFIYGICKKLDGLDVQGTYPRLGGAVALAYGCTTDKTLPNDTNLPHSDYVGFNLDNSLIKQAKPLKIKGYAFVNPTEYDIKNAIINNGVVLMSVKVGNWSRLPVKTGSNGWHYILVYGYNKDRYYFANSWGLNWGDKKYGDGYFTWSEFEGNIRDVMVITDIPNEVLEDAKSAWPYKNFKPSEFKFPDRLESHALEGLQMTRTKYGKPLYPTSDWRPDGSHRFGCDFDLKADGKEFYKWIHSEYKVGTGRQFWNMLPSFSQRFGNDEQYKLAVIAIRCGATRIGFYDKHIHIGFDSPNPQRVMWAGVSE